MRLSPFIVSTWSSTAAALLTLATLATPATLATLATLFAPNHAAAQPAPPADPPSAAPAPEPPPPTPAATPVADPKAPDPRKTEAAAHFARGNELYAGRAWAAALLEFLESRRLYPTMSATANAVVCLKNLQRYDEALDMLGALLTEFNETLPADVKEAAQRDVIALRKLTGSISIDGAVPGAIVSIDGRPRGEYPSPAPLNVLLGSHVVRVYKEGYESFEGSVEVKAGQVATITARMQRLLRSGRLRVTERNGKALDVIVDGFDVGETPWEGPIATGDHTLMLRGAGGSGTLPTPFSIKLNERVELALAAEDLGASIKILPVPATASVAIDGIFVGRGAWEGRLRPGEHPIKVVADGYFPETRQAKLARGASEVISIPMRRDPSSPLWRKPGRFFVDASGGAALTPSFGGEIASSCGDGCSQGIGAGGHVSFHGGYELDTGFSYGVTAGYATMSRTTTSRSTTLTVVGQPRPQAGTVDDTILVRGFLAGAFAGLRLGERFPVRLRVKAGVALGAAADTRKGLFSVSDPTVEDQYGIGPVVVAQSMTWFYLEPELRAGFRLTDHIEISAGLGALLLVTPSPPSWDAEQSINASDDGYGTFASEILTNSVVFSFTPSLGVRYSF
jgi:hypothetical protein